MVRIIGDRIIIDRMRRLPRELRRTIGRTIFVAAGMLETDIRRSIVSGSIQGAGHVPSRPGEPPNRDTGFLDRNVQARRVEELESEVASQAPYSAALEFGTSKMAERPFMRPAAQRMRPRMRQMVTTAIRRFL